MGRRPHPHIPAWTTPYHDPNDLPYTPPPGTVFITPDAIDDPQVSAGPTDTSKLITVHATVTPLDAQVVATYDETTWTALDTAGDGQCYGGVVVPVPASNVQITFAPAAGAPGEWVSSNTFDTETPTRARARRGAGADRWSSRHE
jgi:hypothetical protein